ncbi:MAG: VanW family protein [Clostridiales bacterium]|nr:VanW family protein [Eubacteriales bacterium]MDH7566410.1 VanW family protein [Clostridiales bacterium]
MTKTQRNAFIFSFLFLQFIVSVLGGLFTLNLFTKNKIAPRVYVGGINVGNLTVESAVQKTREYFEDMVKNGFLTVKYLEGEEFKIKYSDIDASMDYDASVRMAYGKGQDRYISLIQGYLVSQDQWIRPAVMFNEEKLRKKFGELAALIDKDPVDANIYLKDGKITKVPEQKGIRLNIDNAVNKVKSDWTLNFGLPLEFKPSDNYEVETVYPLITAKDLEGVEEVVSRFSTEIKSQEDEAFIRLAASAINKVLILPADLKTGEDAGVFSFIKYLSAEKGIMRQNNEGYNQVASTLYAAVLNAGIPKDAITRTPHAAPVDYIDPGLDVVVLGDTIDFKFKNTLDSPLVIFCEVKGNKITVSLVGKKDKPAVK